MDANATTADEIKRAFHQIVSRIAFVVVHDASHECHAIIVVGGATDAQLLVDLYIHFIVLVIATSGDHLEGFVEAVRQEHSAVHILLEVGSDRSGGL